MIAVEIGLAVGTIAGFPLLDRWYEQRARRQAQESPLAAMERRHRETFRRANNEMTGSARSTDRRSKS